MTIEMKMGDYNSKVNVIVTEIKGKMTKTNVPFWACVLSDGTKATIWDAEIAKQVGENIGQNISVELKSKGDFKNIRAVYGVNPSTQTENNPIINQKIPSKDYVESVNKVVNKLERVSTSVSIVAQCLTKAIIGNSNGEVSISDAVNMYNEACLQLINSAN